MYINIVKKAANLGCTEKVGGETARNARYGIARREPSNGAVVRATDIDLDGIAIGEAAHLAFREQAIGEEGEKDKLGKS